MNDQAILIQALKGILAALGQNKTFPADIELAKNMALHALAEVEAA